jgi:hypothetical protein
MEKMSLELFAKMNKNAKPISTQKIIVVCDNCEKEKIIPLHLQISGIEKYKKDLCQGCMRKVQVKLGRRTQQYINSGLGSIKKLKGKTHIEIYGEEKALEMKQKNSLANSGVNNKNYGGTWHGIPPSILYKGKTFDEIYGKEKSDIMKQNLSKRHSGKNNPMYGKPSPQGSGNGWCGWYKEYFFRSLKELSFIIFVIERFKFRCESGEKRKYKIQYKDFDGVIRNYFPDFILNDKYVVEVKPKHLFNTFINKRKKESAIEFCNKNNLKYKMISPIKILTFQEIKKLVDSNQIKFIDRYKQKYENYIKTVIISGKG